jgi:hypothetical protein
MYNMEISIFGYKISIQILILIGIIYLIIISHTICGCCDFYRTIEGFKGIYSNLHDTVDTSSWSAADLSMTNGQPNSIGVQNIMNRKEQPVPLPEGEMSMFATTEFKPECCPNAYSTGSGCACMTMKQYTMLVERGGNNVPFSEY